jgi:hypothetical protein
LQSGRIALDRQFLDCIANLQGEVVSQPLPGVKFDLGQRRSLKFGPLP